MTNPFHSRYAVLCAIIFFYLLPIIVICCYLGTSHLAWNAMSWGLLTAFGGSIALFWILHSRELFFKARGSEKKNATSIHPTPLISEQESHSKEEIAQKLGEFQRHQDYLNNELESKNEEIIVLQRDKEFSQQRYEAIIEEFHQYKINVVEELDQHKTFIQKLQEAIDQQRITIDKKQQQISQLETKVGDLTYEIKTLLHLAESTHSSTASSHSENEYMFHEPQEFATEDYSYLQGFPEEHEAPYFSRNPGNSCNHATEQLKRCLDIAQKMIGSSRFNNENSRFRDLDVDNFALDLRRLCDSLRSENNSAILLYSPKEDKLIFANNQTKTLLGWNPEKIVQSFSEIIQEGNQEWRNTLAHIGLKNESQIRLLLRTKKGHDLLAHCHLGMIPTGIFRYHVIGVLHPA